MKTNNIENYAEEIANLTFDMEKICRKKEIFFCKSINITPVEFRCLRYLLDTTFLQIKSLAKNMDITQARMTTLLNSLESKGYILRKISDKDRRIIELSLTSSGAKFAKELQTKYIDFHKQILKLAGKEESIKTILNNFKEFHIILETFFKNKSLQKENINEQRK
jgi:DNA-binding MarR family transcriptional regulator